MQTLVVTWLNPLRQAWEKAQIEQEISTLVVALSGGVGQARKYHDQHYTNGQQPASKWDRLTASAIATTCKDHHFLPSEYQLIALKFEFGG